MCKVNMFDHVYHCCLFPCFDQSGMAQEQKYLIKLFCLLSASRTCSMPRQDFLGIVAVIMWYFSLITDSGCFQVVDMWWGIRDGATNTHAKNFDVLKFHDYGWCSFTITFTQVKKKTRKWRNQSINQSFYLVMQVYRVADVLHGNYFHLWYP